MLNAVETFYLGFVGGRVRQVHQYGVSSNKMYDYMICCVPVFFALATDDNIVAEYDFGVSLIAPTLEGIVEDIRAFFALPAARRAEMGENGSRAVQERFFYNIVAWDYADLLQGLDPQTNGARS